MTGDCKTIEFLKAIHAADDDLAMVARSAIGIVNDMRLSEINPVAVAYLHELIDHIYQETGEPMLSHLHDGADCDICAALVTRLG
jgi:hypothetical protein